jgi:hypothetical protein
MAKWFFIFSFLFGSLQFGQASVDFNPIGERSDLILVKDKTRTTKMIKKGHGFFEIKDLIETDAGEEYKVDYKFTIKVSFYGNKDGKISLMIPKSYFEDSFWTEIRRGIIQTSNLKIKLKGIKDRVVHNGKIYEDCPVLKIYDIQPTQVHSLIEVIGLKAVEMGILTENDDFAEEVQDLVATATIHPTLNALGVIRMDIDAKVRNYDIKMGFDLKN